MPFVCQYGNHSHRFILLLVTYCFRLVSHCRFQSGTVILIQALHDPLPAVRHQFLNSVLDFLDGLFLFPGQLTAERHIGALLVDLRELLRGKLPLFGHKPRPSRKVLLCTSIVSFVIVASVEPGVVKVPVPGDELRPVVCLPSSQYRAVEFSKRPVRLPYPRGMDHRGTIQKRHIFLHSGGQIGYLSASGLSL